MLSPLLSVCSRYVARPAWCKTRRALCAALLLACSGLAVQAQNAPVVIAMLGDSLVQGYGLPADQSLVAQMQVALDPGAEGLRLINAGVSGDTTAGGAARIDWTLTPDVDGLVVLLGGNDMLRGLDPEQARSNLARILTVARDRDIGVLLIGMPAPGNYGPDYRVAFEQLYPALAERFDVPLYPDFFAGLRQGGGSSPADLRPFMQADGIHPNARGVAAIVSDLSPSITALAQQLRARP